MEAGRRWRKGDHAPVAEHERRTPTRRRAAMRPCASGCGLAVGEAVLAEALLSEAHHLVAEHRGEGHREALAQRLDVGRVAQREVDPILGERLRSAYTSGESSSTRGPSNMWGVGVGCGGPPGDGTSSTCVSFALTMSPSFAAGLVTGRSYQPSPRRAPLHELLPDPKRAKARRRASWRYGAARRAAGTSSRSRR